MKTILKTTVAILIGFAFVHSATALAQTDRGTSIIIDDNPSGLGGPVAGHADHSSTAFEGVGRGVAATIQADAQYNYLTALGATHAERAYQHAIDNYKYRAETLADVHAAYRARTTAQYEPLRARLRSKASVDAAPAAKINWPGLFGRSDLDGYRLLVERAVGQRALGQTMTDYDRTRLNEATRLAMRKIGRDSPFEAVEAQRFLASVLEPVDLGLALR